MGALTTPRTNAQDRPVMSLHVVGMVARISCIIFAVEAVIMFALAGWNIDAHVLSEGLIDSTALTLLASPLIYIWVARPFATAADSARAELKRQLTEMQLLLDQNEKLRTSLQRANEATAGIHEDVLQRIGGDLHDGPAQLLTFALLQMDRLAAFIDQSNEKRKIADFNHLRNVAGDTLKEIRNISLGLSLPELEQANLAQAIRLSVERHEQISGAAIDVAIAGAPEVVSNALKICAYRFVQEALSNAFKHSKAKTTSVSVSFDKESTRELMIAVLDDGQGFDARDTSQHRLGLTGMRGRVQALGGVLEIISSKGAGSRIVARLPVDREQGTRQ